MPIELNILFLSSCGINKAYEIHSINIKTNPNKIGSNNVLKLKYKDIKSPLKANNLKYQPQSTRISINDPIKQSINIVEIEKEIAVANAAPLIPYIGINIAFKIRFEAAEIKGILYTMFIFPTLAKIDPTDFVIPNNTVPIIRIFNGIADDP